jgi:hypothetical protein
VELLQFLLSYGAPETAREQNQAQESVSQPVTSDAPVNCDTKIATKTGHTVVATNSPSPVENSRARVRSAFTVKFNPHDFSVDDRSVLDPGRDGIAAKRRVLVNLVPRVAALAPYLDSGDRAEFLKTAFNLSDVDEKKAAHRRAKIDKDAPKPPAPVHETSNLDTDSECGPTFENSFQ